MNITLNTAIGNNNFIHINKSNNIRYTQTNLLNRAAACDEVSFTGAKENNIPKNEHDQIYCKVIARDLKLNKEQTEILFKTVADFLEEKGYESLRDIHIDGGEEVYEEMGNIEAELQKRIYGNLGYGEDYSQEIGDFIATETVNRIDKGDDYITTGLKRAKVPALKEIFTNNRGSDIAFFKAVKTYLNLTPTQLFDFQTIIEKNLDEPNLIHVNDIIPFDDKIYMADIPDEEIEELEEKLKFPRVMEELKERFNLSEEQEDDIKYLFNMRTKRRDFDAEQALRILKLQKDIPKLEKIMDANGYNDGTRDRRYFCAGLIRNIVAEADKNKYTNLFEIFTKENLSAGKAKSIIYIINTSVLSEKEKGDLVLDLMEASRGQKQEKEEITVKDNTDASIRTIMMANKFLETFNITASSRYTIDEICKAFKQLYPAYITKKGLAIEKDMKAIYGVSSRRIPCFNVIGNGAKPAEVAYILAEKYNLPSNAEKEIIKIIKDVNKRESSMMDYIIYTTEKNPYNRFDDDYFDDDEDFDDDDF